MSTRDIIGRNIKPGQRPGGMAGKPRPGRPRRKVASLDHRQATGWGCVRQPKGVL
jgi:hypothetical protein